jgi:hypothetical protein
MFITQPEHLWVFDVLLSYALVAFPGEMSCKPFYPRIALGRKPSRNAFGVEGIIQE